MKHPLVVSALLALAPLSGVAEEAQMSKPFGTYGYLHQELHKHGIIGELLEKTDLTCCDGGMGGECRGTLLRSTQYTNEYGQEIRWEFLHHQTWCPVYSEVRFDITFPEDLLQQGINGVVCASNTPPDTCPSTTFCSAVHHAPG